jgi:hypothetical protein
MAGRAQGMGKMKFICGIHETNKRVGGGPAKEPQCKAEFDSLEMLIWHIENEHWTALGQGRRK